MTTPSSILAIAARQGGVVTRDQARISGLSDRQIDHRVTSGAWSPVTAGVYRLFEVRGRGATLRAAVAALPGAVVSHFSAARIHRLGRIASAIVSVTVDASTTHRFPGVRVFRTRDLREGHVEAKSDLPVTTVPRTLVDLAAVLHRAHLEVVMDDGVAAGATDWTGVAAVVGDVARRGKPGSTVLREIVNSRIEAGGMGSRLEVLGSRLLVEAGIDGFRREWPVPWSPETRFDLAFVEDKLAIEWDSRRWHTTVEAFESDRRRDREAAAHGWQVVRFTWTDVTRHPGSVIDSVESILERRTQG